MPHDRPDEHPPATALRPAEQPQGVPAQGAAVDAGSLRNAVLWAQDRARMKAIEQAQLEKYMSWNPY